jgi:D-amino-acid oxidase
MDRRSFLQRSTAWAGSSMLALSGCAKKVPTPPVAAAPSLPFYDRPGAIVPIRADVDRMFRITVCLRPFRAAGPRLDVEHIGDKTIVHNYGHGGSGWSLSWGSADVVVRKALVAAGGKQDLAVLGCGALGLTSAITAQRAGFKVTIYAKERPPYVRSSRATGSWTPDSRIALASAVSPDFAALWESMARTSFAMYQSYLGMPGDPIEWTDRYFLRDKSYAQHQAERASEPRLPHEHDFVRYEDRLADIEPASHPLPPGSHPFPVPYVDWTTSLTFNIADYSRQLMNDFQIAGGLIETREFQTPQDFASLAQPVVINCPGYGARQLWSDESIVPVRGQIAWLIPQEGVHYGLNYKGVNVLARRDGIVVQPYHSEEEGWNDTNEQPDRAAAIAGIEVLQDLYRRMESMPQYRAK